MARGISNLTNVDAPGGAYPYGRVRDNPGDNSGTPVNEAMLGDILQLMHALMAEAGLTFNGQPDNLVDSFQLYDAFKGAVRNQTATTSAFGTVQIATQTQVNTGSDTERPVTPATLAGRTATETRTGIAELATQAETDTGTDDARMVTPLKLATTPTVLHVDGSTIVRRKIVDIGDWDMDGTANLSVAHTIGDFKKIRSVQAFVRNDTDTQYYPLNTLNFYTGTAEGGVNYWDTSIVRLGRITGGDFDSADFNATSYNRGYIVIEYTA